MTTLGDAWITVQPTGGAAFGVDVRKIVDSATKGVNASIPVTADTARATASLADMKAKIADLAKQRASITISADDQQAVLAAAQVDLLMARIGKLSAKPTIEIDPVAMARLDEQVARAAVEIDALGTTADDTGKSAAGLGSDLGALSNYGLPALIAAGVALSPVLITAGLGLGGLGLAAYTASKNTAAMDAILGPLKTDVAGFSASLQPEVLTAFGEGAQIAGNLLHDLQPIAAATGTALDSVLSRVDAEFQSGNWQQFFQFMAKTAGPDVQLLGNLIVDLTTDLPPLLEALQPVAMGFLTLADDASLAVGALEKVQQIGGKTSDSANSVGLSLTGVESAAKRAGEQLLNSVIPGFTKTVPEAEKLAASADKASTSAQGAGKNLSGAALAASALAASAQSAKPPTDAENAALFVTNTNAAAASSAVTKLNSAWSAFLGLSTSLVTAQLGVEGGLKTLTTDSNATGASFTGVNAASQKLQDDFETGMVPGLQNVLNGMRQAGAGSHDLSTVLATDLKPAVDAGALSNKALEQQIFDMATEAGYAGPNKLAPLQAWIDKNAGSAKTAAGLVNSFGAALADLPKAESLQVIMQGKGTYAIVNSTTGVPYPVRAAAAGMYVAAGTTPTADDVLVRASKGELIVPANMVSAGAVDHLRGAIPGFAAGGWVGNWNLTPQFVSGMYGDFTSALAAGTEAALSAGISQAQAAAQAAAMSGGISGAGVSNASAEMALASAANKMGWGGAQWQALYNVEMREAGFSLTATNPSSGAYGMAQFINGPSEYAQYGGNATTAAGQAVAMVNYIAQRYGNPANAWAHELAYGWYDRGGTLQPGYTMAYNGTGRPETVSPPGALGGGPAQPGGMITAQQGDAIIGLLEQVVSVTGQQGSKFAGALQSTAARSASIGSYSTRR